MRQVVGVPQSLNSINDFCDLNRTCQGNPLRDGLHIKRQKAVFIFLYILYDGADRFID
jgi:hypothetical protein